MKEPIVISESKKKNIKMVVYHPTGPDGKKYSITRHLPLNDAKPVYNRFANKTRSR